MTEWEGQVRAEDRALVADLLAACPFLAPHLDPESLDLPTVVFGQTALAVRSRSLPIEQEDAVFGYFNDLAGRADQHVQEILATGAIELFNDDAASQRLARTKLTGRAAAMLEEMRISWRQPDHGP